MNELALFAGGGGGILGGKLLGWRTRCAVEIDPFARRVLLARQRDGSLHHFPIWDDVKTFDGKPWRGSIDVISGGFPCQDISSAGHGAGLSGERSGLWFEFARIIREVEPSYVFIENSDQLRTRGLATVLSNLAEMGFNAKWGVVSGAHVAAPCLRKRMWIVAVSNRGHGEKGRTLVPQSDRTATPWGDTRHEHKRRFYALRSDAARAAGMVDGVANRVDRLRVLGNGQIPAVAALAWRALIA